MSRVDEAGQSRKESEFFWVESDV